LDIGWKRDIEPNYPQLDWNIKGLNGKVKRVIIDRGCKRVLEVQILNNLKTA
jgi:hypothetical protein